MSTLILAKYGTNIVRFESVLWKVSFIYCIAAVDKGKDFPYSLPSVGPGDDPGVQAVSPQVTVSHPLSGRLPLLSTRPVITFPAAEHHRPLAGTKLYCLVRGT